MQRCAGLPCDLCTVNRRPECGRQSKEEKTDTKNTRLVRMASVFLVVALLSSMVLASSAGATWRRSRGFTLTILHNNDGESELLPNGDEGGVARFATVVWWKKIEALFGSGCFWHCSDGKRGVILVS